MTAYPDPDVSVIICVRNGARVLGHQLAALGAQVGAPAFEVLVVDNGSTDGTRELVQDWLAQPHAAGRRRLLDAGARPGIPHARNVGAEAARGRLLAFCDADDRVRPEWVASFAAAVGPDVLAGGLILAQDPDGTPRPEVFPQALIATGYLPHVGNCNCAIERETFLRLGGYDESLPAYGFVDVDISWRAQESGVRLAWVPEAVIDMVLSRGGTSVAKKFALGRGRVLMARRFPHYDEDYTVLVALRLLRGSAAEFVRCSWRQRRPDRRWAAQVVGNLGRVMGALEYPARRGAPERKLLR